MKNILFLIITAAVILYSAAGCDNTTATNSNNQALLIRTAINNDDVKTLRTLSELPLHIRNQEWKSSSDGYGFTLSDYTEENLSSESSFQTYFNNHIASINIEGSDDITENLNLELFSDELKDLTTIWGSLELHLLKRGEGDVEHIVLLGLDKKSHKLRAIYIN